MWKCFFTEYLVRCFVISLDKPVFSTFTLIQISQPDRTQYKYSQIQTQLSWNIQHFQQHLLPTISFTKYVVRLKSTLDCCEYFKCSSILKIWVFLLVEWRLDMWLPLVVITSCSRCLFNFSLIVFPPCSLSEELFKPWCL